MDQQTNVATVQRRTREEIRQIVAEFATSGMQPSEFCRSRGISRSSLDRYLRRQRVQDPGSRAGNRLLAVEIKDSERELSEQQQRVGGGVKERTQDRSEPGLRCGHTGAPADGIGQGVGRWLDLGQRRGSTWPPELRTCARGLMVCTVWCATIWAAIPRAAMFSCSAMRGAIA